MSTTWVLLGVVLAFAIGFLLVRVIRASHLYVKLLGKRVITCPETAKPAAVDVAAGRVALKSLARKPHLRLSDCTRWPEREDCGQTCLSQIENTPDGCLVTKILEDWYRSRACAFCGRLFGEMNWVDRRGALLGPDGKTVLWEEVSPETLPGVLASYRPVCWSCHIAQTFRREHPDLVVDRSWKRTGPFGGIARENKDIAGKTVPRASA